MKSPDGPKDNPIRQLAALITDPYGYLKRCQDRYGKVFTLRVPGQDLPWIVVSEPAVIKQVSAMSYEEVERRSAADPFFSPLSLLLLQGAAHRQKRRQLSPTVTGERLRGYGPIILETTDTFLRPFFQDPGAAPILFLKQMQELTLWIMVRCMFSDSSADQEEGFRSLLRQYVEQNFTLPMMLFNMAVGTKRLRRILDGLGPELERLPSSLRSVAAQVPVLDLAQTRKLTAEKIRQRVARCVANPDGSRRSMLSQLLSDQREHGEQMSEEDLHAQLLTLLMTGHETTATTLAWAMHCIITNPGVAARLRAELRSAGCDRDQIDPERVRELPYLGAVILESMRLFPIFPLLTRRLLRPMQIAGYDVPAGNNVIIGISLAQHDPVSWPAPTRFLPERMLGQRPAPPSFFPLGFGPWRCLGAALVDYEMRVVLARLIARFDIEPEPGTSVRPATRWMTVFPHNRLPVRIKAAR